VLLQQMLDSGATCCADAAADGSSACFLCCFNSMPLLLLLLLLHAAPSEACRCCMLSALLCCWSQHSMLYASSNLQIRRASDLLHTLNYAGATVLQQHVHVMLSCPDSMASLMQKHMIMLGMNERTLLTAAWL
jgi:hypothetical protein